MANPHGDFIWYELLATDVAGAEAFYAGLLGWTATKALGDMDYWTLALPDGAEVGGLMAAPDGAPPQWLGYIAVSDADATAAAILADGGRQTIPPTDIPGIGRFALLADPQGVPFYIMRGASDETSGAFHQSAVGHCNWNELMTPDPTAALAFYGKHFGWEKGDAMPMGEMGDYQFIDHGGQTIGAVMGDQTGQSAGRPPSFLYYFGVGDIDRAARTVTAGGGALHHGPQEIPGGHFIVIATDPQGAAFGLVGPRNG